MFPVLAGALKQICVLEGSILKGIHGETVIWSFSHSPNLLIKPCMQALFKTLYEGSLATLRESY
jgi:hypothetical protein